MTLLARVFICAAVIAAALVPGAAGAAPANDDRAAAVTVPSLPHQVVTSNDGATVEAGEKSLCTDTSPSAFGATLWFTYTPARDLTLVVDPAGSSIRIVVGLYTASGQVACADRPSDAALPTFDLTRGTTYAIQVGGFLGATGDLVLNFSEQTTVTPPPPVSGNDREVTVVAVVDGGFSPYHYDFVGHQHPWNTDADPANDIDLTADPATYIENHPGATAVPLTIPTAPNQTVSGLRNGADAAAWDMVEESDGQTAHLYWFPGTKIVGAVTFDGGLYGSNSSHGTRSAASAVGNIHGTCPECLVVLVDGFVPEALRWAASQPWIDVVTNSYGHSTTPVARDNIYFGSPVEDTKASSEDGQVVVFSAGNGFDNGFLVPQLTYWSSEKGPDWMVTVGAVSPRSRQSYVGHGKPVDISSIGSSYPSTGGSTATGTGNHSGTSNAAPVVAGYFGQALQDVREVLGDVTAGHSGGVVASGAPVACDACPLADGVLTRAELQDLVYYGSLPSPSLIATGGVIPTTEYAYYYQGHGVLAGRLNPDLADEQARMVAVATGAEAPLPRPDGETDWFVVDSKCRQRLWGTWNGGYYRGTEPALDPQDDPLAISFNAWCTALPPGALRP